MQQSGIPLDRERCELSWADCVLPFAGNADSGESGRGTGGCLHFSRCILRDAFPPLVLAQARFGAF